MYLLPQDKQLLLYYFVCSIRLTLQPQVSLLFTGLVSHFSLVCPQGPEALCGRHLRGPRAQPGLPHGDVHLLRGLLRGLSLLLCQHLCGFDHHHLPGAGGQGHVGVQPGKERGL